MAAFATLRSFPESICGGRYPALWSTETWQNQITVIWYHLCCSAQVLINMNRLRSKNPKG